MSVAEGLGRDDLREAARAMLQRESSSERVRAAADGDDGFDPRLWATMADQGWPSLLVPEEHGGLGASLGHMGVLLHEMGRQVTASPLMVSAVLAVGALLLAGDENQQARWLPGLAAGKVIGTVACTGPSGRPTREAVAVRAQPSADGWRLGGQAAFVPDAHLAGLVVVIAVDHDSELHAFLLEPQGSGLAVTPTMPWDPTRRLCRIEVDATLGDEACLRSRPDLLDRLVDLGAYGLACDSLGVAERVLEMTTAYGRERVQFDRPIGSFQAWKHRCADLFIQVEASRAALRAATWALDHNADDASARVSAAKFICGDGATLVAGDGVQLHGGIGYTWEHDMHLFQKRAKLNQALFGDSDYHRDRLAAAILP